MLADCSVSPVVLFEPGDELRLICEYDSTIEDHTIKNGPSTSDEMCVAFVGYYPADPSFQTCFNYGTTPVCSNAKLLCDIDEFTHLLRSLESVCNGLNCSSGCRSQMQDVVNTGCMEGDIGEMLMEYSPNITAVFALRTECGVSMMTHSPDISTPVTSKTPTGKTKRNANNARHARGNK